jgi:hypothetical protein
MKESEMVSNYLGSIIATFGTKYNSRRNIEK